MNDYLEDIASHIQPKDEDAEDDDTPEPKE